MTTHGPEPDWLGRVDRWSPVARLGGRCPGHAGCARGTRRRCRSAGRRGSAGPPAGSLVLVACFAVLQLTVAVVPGRRRPRTGGRGGDARDRARAGRPGRPTTCPAAPPMCRRCSCRRAWCSCSSCTPLRRGWPPIAAASLWRSRSLAWRSRPARRPARSRQFTAGGWLVGFYVGLGPGDGVLDDVEPGPARARCARQRALTERAESARLAVLEERARIAREMHDIVAHSLAVIVRQAEGGAFVAERDPGAGRAGAADDRRDRAAARWPTCAACSACCAIRPAAVADAPQPTLADLPRLVAGVRDTGLDAELTSRGRRSRSARRPSWPSTGWPRRG